MNKVSKPRLVNYIVPAVMLSVFLIQMYLVDVHNFNRWKGMGMGMFSKINVRSVQQLDVKIEDEWIDFNTQMSLKHPDLVIDFRQFPNGWTQSRLLGEIQNNQTYVTSLKFIVTEVDGFNPRNGLVTEGIVYETHD